MLITSKDTFDFHQNPTLDFLLLATTNDTVQHLKDERKTWAGRKEKKNSHPTIFKPKHQDHSQDS